MIVRIRLKLDLTLIIKLVKFSHMEPEKNIASAYGWSFMPPHRSVPKKAPYVFLKMELNRQLLPFLIRELRRCTEPIGQKSNLPKVEYTEKYNANCTLKLENSKYDHDPLKGKNLHQVNIIVII